MIPLHGLKSRTMAAVSITETENLLDKNKDKLSPNILVTGKTGVGKSRLVNALVGENVTKEGACKSTPYEAVIEDVAVTVWDSPGLQDGTTNEDRYIIQDMKDNTKYISLMIYCVRMDEARFHKADKKAIQTLTNEFGKEVWNHAVVALTFANKVEDPDEEDELGYFQSQHEEWKKQVKDHFASIGIKPEVGIPVIPVSNGKKKRLPDGENWLSDLWIECSQAIEASRRRGMYRINRPLSLSATPAQIPAPTTKYNDGIPGENPSNAKNLKLFLRTAWNFFVSHAGVVVPITVLVGIIFGGPVGGAAVFGTIGLITLVIRRYFF